VLAARGNHDIGAGDFAAVLGCPEGARDIGPYRFVVFHDPYEGDLCTRPRAGRELLAAAAAQSDRPVVVLQHNPVFPAIDDDYPYMHTNNAQLRADYAAAGVLLSLSGHYHAGQTLAHEGGVGYLTAPMLGRGPYSYCLVKLAGRRVEVECRQLAMPATPPVVDCHAHTQYAYCGRGISGQGIIERSRLLGLSGLVLTEHAPQLYLTADDFWAKRHILEPASWRAGEHSRMAQFRTDMEALRRPGVKFGLEVELDGEGELTVAPEDRDWADILVGAVHWLKDDAKTMSQDKLAQEFMATTLALLGRGVDILAHPLRLFGWTGHPTPPELYAPLAEALAATSTAAEINLHKNPNDPAFFRECIRRGVKISLGSDAHVYHESAALQGHLSVLAQAAPAEDVGKYLYTPFAPGEVLL
jgi:histidinol phosphatase-like PHP family hydrolase